MTNYVGSINICDGTPVIDARIISGRIPFRSRGIDSFTVTRGVEIHNRILVQRIGIQFSRNNSIVGNDFAEYDGPFEFVPTWDSQATGVTAFFRITYRGTLCLYTYPYVLVL